MAGPAGPHHCDDSHSRGWSLGVGTRGGTTKPRPPLLPRDAWLSSSLDAFPSLAEVAVLVPRRIPELLISFTCRWEDASR